VRYRNATVCGAHSPSDRWACPPCCDVATVSAGLALEPAACTSRVSRRHLDRDWRCVSSVQCSLFRDYRLPSVTTAPVWPLDADTATVTESSAWTDTTPASCSWGPGFKTRPGCLLARLTVLVIVVRDWNISCISSVPPGKSWTVHRNRPR
jgi:hypothetical protein